MRCLCFGLMLGGLTSAAHAEKGGGVFDVSKLDLSTTRFVHSDSDYLPPVSFNQSVLSARSAGIAPAASGSGSLSQLSPVADPKKDYIRAAKARWREISDGGHISMSHLMRVELKGEKYKVTLRPDSASMETGHLKLALRSGSASMQWSKVL